MTLTSEIADVRRAVVTDHYQMSVGEVINMYRDGELIINPVFQRLFRWSTSQKSRLIESILIGIPLPSIFVYETTGGKWELIDGLQRISTLLEFMGLLLDADGTLKPPSALEATTYLPGLHNAVWVQSSTIQDVPKTGQVPIDSSHQLAIRRSRISVEILKRPSDAHTKYDLFQRLNSGGTVANPQELRNCVIVMVNPGFFDQLRKMARFSDFISCLHLTYEQFETQRDIEYLTRFIVYSNIQYDGKLDVEDYVDKGIVKVAEQGLLQAKTVSNFQQTFQLLTLALGSDALKQHSAGQFKGRVGLTALEIVAVGISANLEAIQKLSDPATFVRHQTVQLWTEAQVKMFSRPGLRGTQRIRKTLPFGKEWFKPSNSDLTLAKRKKTS